MSLNYESKKKLPLPERSNAYIFWLLLAYIILEITGIVLHPLWRDEMYTWSITGSSTSLADLFHRKIFDGHPDLWYLLVYWVRILSNDPLSMQLMHSCIAVLTAFLILKYAPFSRLHRGLLIFGYFYLFEYAVISRNYAIGLLLVTLLLVLWPGRHRLLIVIGLLMFLLCQSSVFGIILCVAFLGTYIFEFIFSPEGRAGMLRHKTGLVVALILIISGIMYSLYRVIPPPAGYYSGVTQFSFSQLTLPEFLRSIGTVWKAWIPLPLLQVHFWNTNIIRPEVLQAALSLLLLFSAGLLFVKRPVVLFLYITGVSGVIAFILIYYFGFLRHHGHLFIVLISCLWLRALYPENTGVLKSGFFEQTYRRLNRIGPRLFTLLLIVHVMAGAFALTVQTFVPFTAARQTARYIRQHKLDRFRIAGDQDVALQTVSGYLGKEVFYFSRNAPGTYLVYDKARTEPSPSRVLAMADSIAALSDDTLLLVMNYPLREQADLKLRKIASFEESIVGDEIYYLYLFSAGRKTP